MRQRHDRSSDDRHGHTETPKASQEKTERVEPIGHIALLGESIFDNGACTPGLPDVVTHLRKLLSPGWTATLCAVDGATTTSLAPQLARVPNDAILRTAIDLNLCALELRTVCTEFGDYTNAIEPSGQGGLKIAKAVARMVGTDRGLYARIWRA